MYEDFVRFSMHLSVVGARSVNGATTCFPVTENHPRPRPKSGEAGACDQTPRTDYERHLDTTPRVSGPPSRGVHETDR